MNSPKICPWCKTAYIPRQHKGQLTCGKSACRRNRKRYVEKTQRYLFGELEKKRIRREGREIGSQYHCEICGDVYECKAEHHILCGKPECRKERKRRQSRFMRAIFPSSSIMKRASKKALQSLTDSIP